ncbi:MAG: hypothetical protein WBM02_08020 [bacterium]
MNKQTYSFIIFLIVLLIVHLSAMICNSFETIDDAFISFRYAENLAVGNGLVFNPGERVEGYTNFLWILLLALVRPLVEPVLASKILGALCSCLLIIFFARYYRRFHPEIFGFPILYLALDPGLITWSVRGLETTMFTLFIWLAYQTAMTASIKRNDTSAGLAGSMAAFAVLTRPEGVLTHLFFPLLVLLQKPREHSIFKRISYFFIGSLTLMLPYLIWKWCYFGDILPNTFYAKTGGGFSVFWRGLAYIIQGWQWPEGILLIVIFISLCRNEKKGLNRHAVLVAAVFLLIFLAYILAVGGDSLGPDRFLTPLLPFMILPAFFALSILKILRDQQTHRFLVGIVAFILIIGNSYPMIANFQHTDVFSHKKELQHHGTHVGLCLAKNARPNQSIATSIIGRIPYYSKLYTFDVFGLIDPYIAHQTLEGSARGAAGHEKSDWYYILSRNPDFIIGQELIAAPPREPNWLKSIRTSLSGESTYQIPSGIPAPPYPGYSRIELSCDGPIIRIWKRNPRPEQEHVLMP